MSPLARKLVVTVFNTVLASVVFIVLVVKLLGPTNESTPTPDEGSLAPNAAVRPVDSFPYEAAGCYRCGVASIYYRPGADEPREDEREGATLGIVGVRLGPGLDLDDRGAMMIVVEGCPFFVTRAPQPNPQSFSLGPSRCGDTRYDDGFLIIRSETIEGETIFRTLPTGEAVDCEPGECDRWERAEWSVTAQLTGRVANGEHTVHTYDCVRAECLR